MNYDHAYHAGSLSDVFKHLFLINAIRALSEKPKGFLYIETHAGRGLYDLESRASEKTQEAEQGIISMFSLLQKSTDPSVQTYCRLLQQCNQGFDPQRLRYYPGSVLFAQALLRTQDRMHACELEPKAFNELQKHIRPPILSTAQCHRTHFYCEDGYQLLKRSLPSLEKRTLILIDPPYEHANEWNVLENALKNIYQRQANSVVLVWYPFKAQLKIQQWLAAVQKIPFNSLLNVYWKAAHTAPSSALRGAGLLISNPPWQFDKQAETLLSLFSKQKTIEWLRPPS